jgi:hypothetical protein
VPKYRPDPAAEELKLATERGVLPTSLGTAGLRAELAAELRVKSVFLAKCSNVRYLSFVKVVIDKMAAGEIGEGQARTFLYDFLKMVDYTPDGGFPDQPAGTAEPALRGTLQDLSSYRRVNLIIRTQYQLYHGRAQQLNGSDPQRLATAPAWELIRVEDRNAPRDWPARWVVAGGTLVEGGRMIALKGDPIWGELGSSGNFDDALDVDHPPFAFQSGMGWEEISKWEWDHLGLTGPDGLSADEFLATRPETLLGLQALPAVRLSLSDVDPELVAELKRQTEAKEDPQKPDTLVSPVATETDPYAALRARLAREETARIVRYKAEGKEGYQ